MVEARTAPMPEQGPQQAQAPVDRTVENVAVADTDPSTLASEPTLKMEPTLAPELTLRPLSQSTGGRPAPLDIPTQVTIPTVGLSPFNALTPLVPGLSNTHNLVLNSSPDQGTPNMSPFYANNPAIKSEPESAEKGFTGLQPHAAAVVHSPTAHVQPGQGHALQAAGAAVQPPTLQPDTAMGILARLPSAGKESSETKWYEDLAAQIEEDPEKAVEQIEYFSSSLLVGKETAAARKRAAQACPHPLFSPLAAAAAEEGVNMRQHAELVMEDGASTFRVQCFDPRHTGVVMFTEYTSALEACIASESLNMQLENPSLMVSSGAMDKAGARAQYNARQCMPGPGVGMYANVNLHARHGYPAGYGQMDMHGMQAAYTNGNGHAKKGKAGQQASQGYGYDGMHAGGAITQYMGIEWDVNRKMWTAFVEEGPRKKKVVLSKFYKTDVEAAKARDAELIKRGLHMTQPLNFRNETTGYMPESGYGDHRWGHNNGYGYANAGYPNYGMQYPGYYGGYNYGQPAYSPYDYDQDYDQDMLIDNYRRGSMGGGQGLIGGQRKRGTPHSADYVYDVPGAKKAKVTKDKYGGLPTTKYRGVVWDEQHEKWRAQLIDGGHKRVLGYYEMPEDAARVYDMAIVRDNRKEKTNFPPTMYKEGNHLTLTTGKTARGSPAVKVTSQYKGVSWNSACSKWVAVLWDRELKRARHIGSFESEEAAARAYDREAIKMLGADAGLNFRESLDDYVRTTGIELRVTEPGMSGGKGSSQYRGVSWHERSQRWEVRVWGGGKQHFIGSFTDEVGAARAYDKAVLRLRGQDARSRSRMNFPLSDYNMEEVLKEPMFSFANAYPATSSGGGWCRSGGGVPPPEEPSYPDSWAEQNPPRRSGRPPRPRHDDDMTTDVSAGSAGEDDVSMNGPSQTLQPQATPTELVADNDGKPIIKESPDNSGRNLLTDEGMDRNHEDDPQKRSEVATMGAGGSAAPDVRVLSDQVAAIMSSLSGGTTGKTMAAGHRRSSGGSANGGAAAFNGEVEARNRSSSGRGNLSRKASLGVAAATAALAAVDTTPERSPRLNSGGGTTPVGAVSAFGSRQSSGSGTTPSMSNGGLPRSGSMSGGLVFTSLVPPGQTTRGKSSTYKGVSWCEKVRKWRALLWDGTKQRFLGHYSTDLEAAKAYDRALLDLKGYDAKPNFPAYTYECEGDEEGGHRRPVSSSFKGVSLNKSTGKWEARIRYNSRTYIIGSYNSEHEAARAHDCASLCTGGGQPNFPSEPYDEAELNDANIKMTAALEAGGEPADSQQPDSSQGGADTEGDPARKRRRTDTASMNGRPMEDVVNDIQVGVCLTAGTEDVHPVVKEAQLRALQGYPSGKKGTDKYGASVLQITVDATQSDNLLQDQHNLTRTNTTAKEMDNNRTPMLGATGNTPRVEMDGPLFDDHDMEDEPFAGSGQGARHHAFTLPTPRLNQAGEIVCDAPLDAWEQGLPNAGNLPSNNCITLDPDNHHDLNQQQLGAMSDQHAELLHGAGLSDSQPLRLGGKPVKAAGHHSNMPYEAAADQAAAAAGLPSSAMRSHYRGVTWHVVNNKYIARIRNNAGANTHLGCFDTQEEAAQAYDIAAIALRGPQQAITNFPTSQYLTANGTLWPELLDVLSKSSSPINPVAAAIAGSVKHKASGGQHNSQDMNRTEDVNGHEDMDMH